MHAEMFKQEKGLKSLSPVLRGCTKNSKNLPCLQDNEHPATEHSYFLMLIENVSPES